VKILKKRVMIGISGGVDSAVAAYLLLKDGYDVVGVTLNLWKENDITDAKNVCNMLKIEHLVFDFTYEFEKFVINNFIDEYKNGRTPNPCIVCNRFLKFEMLLKKAEELGFDFIATGHYARVEQNKETKRYVIRKSVYDKKDQSYVLYRLTQNQLAKTLMPLYSYSKDEIRCIAKEIGLDIANKKDSQDICFIPDGDYISFLKKYINLPPAGFFLDDEGNKIGKHLGIASYTIGQRKGLGMTFGKPMFVTKIDALQNTVTLSQSGKQFKKTVFASDVNFLPFENLDRPAKFLCKLRYSSHPEEALITPLGDGKVKIEFENVKSAACPGQSAVFYDGDLLIGGGIIYDME
jgi:tRNA-specific 2-thiouridylase